MARNIGEIIHELRKKENITQEKLAEALNNAVTKLLKHTKNDTGKSAKKQFSRYHFSYIYFPYCAFTYALMICHASFVP